MVVGELDMVALALVGQEDEGGLLADGAPPDLLQAQKPRVERERGVQVLDADHGVGESHGGILPGFREGSRVARPAAPPATMWHHGARRRFMTPKELWDRYCRHLCAVDRLGFRLDISRMRFDEAFLERMEPRMQAAYTEMEA